MSSFVEHTGILGHKHAAHLLRRCTYCFTKAQVDLFATKTPKEAVDDLFTTSPLSIAEPIDYKMDTNGGHWINIGGEAVSGEAQLRLWVIGWWINEARKDTSIQHKLEFFLHQNFIVSANSALSRELYDYMALIRHYSLISYKTLAYKITLDNVMIRYLDGNSNTKISPNENYAREFFELFTIGKGPQIGIGNYTTYEEADVIAAAKVLTGWIGRPRPFGGDDSYRDPDTDIQQADLRFQFHDTTDKQFSAAFDNAIITGAIDNEDAYRELDDLVELIFNQPATAHNIARKLYRFFVGPTISEEVEAAIISPMATLLQAHNYNLEPALKVLLISEHFYDLDDADNADERIGAMIKSPLESLLQTLSFFDIPIPDPFVLPREHYNMWYSLTVLSTMKAAGMFVYEPDSVAGYPAYYSEPSYARNWFNGSTLIARYKIPEIVLSGKRILTSGSTGGVQLNITLFVRDAGVITTPSDGTLLVRDLITYLFVEEPTSDRFNYFLNDIFLDGLSLINWQFEWQHYITSNDDSGVKIPLERLLKALLSSQEFQVM